MPNTTVYTNNQYYQEIAAAIRNKNGTNNTYTPREMGPAINALVTSGETLSLQSKTVDPTTLTQTIFADTGYHALEQVTVTPIQTETKTVTVNGIVTPSSGKYFSSINVAVLDPDINLQSVSVSPTESVQTITASEGYQGLDTVTVGAISTTYVGTGVARKNASNITINENTVTAPAGYYTSAATVTIPSVSQAVPTITVSSDGQIIATASQSAGYVSSGVESATEQLNTADGETIDPSETAKIAVQPGTYVTGTITVAAIPSNYVGSGISTRSAADLTANGAVVEVPAGYYSSTTSKSVATATQRAPSTRIDGNGKIVATITYDGGYIAAGSKTSQFQMTTKSGTTIIPSASYQTIMSASTYATGTIAVAAVPSETKTFTENGTYTPSSGK